MGIELHHEIAAEPSLFQTAASSHVEGVAEGLEDALLDVGSQVRVAAVAHARAGFLAESANAKRGR